MRLTTAIRKCTKCTELASTRTNVVIGDGPIPCDMVFLGEAPGRNEDETGVAFCGVSGNRLEVSAQRYRLVRGKDYHILNTLKCRPPENRDPTADELTNCKPFLLRQLKVVKPKVVVAFGRFAQAFVLNVPFSKVRVLANMGVIVRRPDFHAILSCHPAYTRYNDEVFQAFQGHIGLAKEIANGKDMSQCIVQVVEL